MRSPAEALALILERVAPLAPLRAEAVPLAEAAGRALAAPLRAPADLPPFDASTMDGYAFRAADAPRAGARLPVAFEVAAGHPARGRLPRGACCRIFTGAALPPGADCVEQQERVAREGAIAVLARPGVAGRSIRPAGGDLRRGAIALPAGTEVDAGAIGLAAALGLARLTVHRRPTVAILPTGDEVVPLGARRRPGQIVESNAHAVAAAAREAGAVPRVLPIARDDLRALARALATAGRVDVLVTTGGVSVGERDLLREALVRAGGTIDLWRVAMRPGKPFLFGRLGRTLLFGLPGSPASALVGFELLVRPALRALAGLPGGGRTRLRARLAAAQEKPAELALFLRGAVERRDGAIWFAPLPAQASGNPASAAAVGALGVLPAGRRRLRRGEAVECLLLRPIADG